MGASCHNQFIFLTLSFFPDKYQNVLFYIEKFILSGSFYQI